MSKKRNIAIVAAILFAFIGGVFAYSIMAGDAKKKSKTTVTGNVVAESASADDMYKMFLCPCCGNPLDKNNICCGMAEEMIKYIDSQMARGVSKDEVVLKA